MNRLGAAFCRGVEYAIRAQIGLAWVRRADQPRFVATAYMQGSCVGFGIDRHRVHAKPLRRARDAAGNFPAVGYEYFFKHPDPVLG